MHSHATVPNEQRTILRFGDCELHLLTREFWRNGNRHTPPRRVFDLLRLLIERRPRAVSHADIAKALWGRAEVRSALVAQAVMQVRQLVGDLGDEPSWILTVRGIGYRFAGAVGEGLTAAQEVPPPARLDELHDALADAEAAMNHGDLERAQFQAERAISLAQDLGINSQRGSALVLAAHVALTRGELERAAALASQAQRLAESEGLHDLAAKARLRLARLRLLAGDVHGALALAQALYPRYQMPGDASERAHCERMITLAYRQMKQYEHAVDWCARALATAREAQLAREVELAETLLVDVTLLLAEALEERGQDHEARLAWERAVDLNAAFWPQAELASDPALTLAWLGNQSIALRGLGRLAESWDMLERMQQTLDEAPSSYGPANPLWVVGIRRERALLLARWRRFEEAKAAIAQALDVGERGGLQAEMPALLKVASRVCEEAGRLNEALVWLRKSQAATDALQLQRTSAQAAVLQAEAQTDALRLELQTAVQSAQQLALENRALTQRLQQLEADRRRSDADFQDAQCLGTVLRPRHADAVTRDMPYCIALLVVENLAELQPPDADPAAAPWQRALWRALNAVLGPDHGVVHWRPGLFLHELAGQGERRARDTCQRMQADLAAFAWRRALPAIVPVPRVRVIGLDAARHETLDEALLRLLRQAQSGGGPAQARDAADHPRI